MRVTLALVALLAFSLVPLHAAGATDPAARCQTFSTSAPCSFACHAGDVLGATGIHGSAAASCGGAVAACRPASGEPDCLGGGDVVLVDGTGTCAMTSRGEYADCFALAAPTDNACGTMADYDACSYHCQAGSTMDVQATSTLVDGYPRVLSVCGLGHAECQAQNACEGIGKAHITGDGICLSRTVDTTTACKAN